MARNIFTTSGNAFTVDGASLSFRKDWTPAEITTIGWYDPSDSSTITESGGAVSQLDDKSGNDNHMVQATGSAQPTTGVRTQNGRNVLDYDGGSDYLEDVNFPVPSSGDIAIFAVAEIDSVSHNNDSVFSMDATRDFQYRAGLVSSFNGQIDVTGIGVDIWFSGGPFPGPSIYNANFDYTGDVIYNGYVDGTKRGADTAYTDTLNTLQKFRLASNRAANIFMDGGIGEVILVEDCSEDCRQNIEGYLAHKWGLTGSLPGGHPYKTVAP